MTNRRRAPVGAVAWGAVFAVMTACNCGPPVPAGGLSPVLLGVEPVPSAPDSGAFASEFVAAVGAFDGTQAFVVPGAEEVRVTCDGATCEPVASGVARPGAMVGLLAIVLDDSGSNGASPTTCVGCPTDPSASRVAAIRVLLRRLYGRAPGWRVALFDFGRATNGSFSAATHLAGYTSYEADFDEALDNVTPGFGTYIFDSIREVVPTLAGERVALDGGASVARLLMVSDGEDTSSKATFEEAVALAEQHRIIIDAVGYGQRGDAGTVVLAPKGYRDLRRLAVRTGGFATVVASDELPTLFARIAELYVAGYAERRFQMPTGAKQVKGSVQVGEGPRSSFRFEDFP